MNLAELVIIDALKSPNEQVRLEAAKTTLRSLGRNYGWGDGAHPIVLDVSQDKDSQQVKVKAVFGIPPSEDELGGVTGNQL